MDASQEQKDQAAALLAKALTDAGMDSDDAGQLGRVTIEKAAKGEIPQLPARRVTTGAARVAYDEPQLEVEDQPAEDV